MAKSNDGRLAFDALTLSGHSLRVERAARALHDVIGADLERTFGLDAQSRAQLAKLSTLAALLHDIGKATTSFQATVDGRSKERHPWRHEFLSAGAVQAEGLLRPWLTKHLDSDDVALVAMMIAGHHLRAGRSMTEPRVSRDERLLLASPHLHVVWEHAARLLSTETLPVLKNRTLTPEDGSDLMGDYITASRTSDCARYPRSLLLPVGKALVIAADIVGSARTEDRPIEEWIVSVLAGGLTAEELEGVVKHRLRGNEPRGFQKRVAASEATVTVVTAGCGNGKTIAAYLWARRHALARRLAFCYPTTGTTTAGFAEYLLAQTKLERRLLQSRARVDVESFSPDDDEPLELWAPDVLDRWSARVVACTADTVLGLMTNWRTALASLPLWAKCAFVFDEVHSYDRALFGALLAFLSVVRAPVLLMTASLSPARKDALARLLGPGFETIDGDPEIETAKRYRLLSSSSEDAVASVIGAVLDRKKVLWVVNTVERAKATYRILRERLGCDAVRLYHSRFRYRDRVDRQADVIKRFKPGCGGIAVVATQVCEMSLDLSADVLVTELAPYPSLIQRLGRLNRSEKIPAQPQPCFWLEPSNSAPYGPPDLDDARKVLTRLGAEPLSQRDLADALAGLEEPAYEMRATPFLMQTWETEPRRLREGAVAWTIVRQCDLPEDLAKTTRANVICNEISMVPRDDKPPSWKVVHGAYVVPNALIKYCKEEGASWAF